MLRGYVYSVDSCGSHGWVERGAHPSGPPLRQALNLRYKKWVEDKRQPTLKDRWMREESFQISISEAAIRTSKIPIFLRMGSKMQRLHSTVGALARGQMQHALCWRSLSSPPGKPHVELRRTSMRPTSALDGPSTSTRRLDAWARV